MYYVYILRCEDESLYTGITTDPQRRFAEHSGCGGRGAKYTASHRPLRFECLFSSPGRVEASKLEYRIKRLARAKKEALILGSVPEGLLPEGCRRTAPPELKAK